MQQNSKFAYSTWQNNSKQYYHCKYTKYTVKVYVRYLRSICLDGSWANVPRQSLQQPSERRTEQQRHNHNKEAAQQDRAKLRWN